LLGDSKFPEIPDWIPGELVAATSTCIAIGTRVGADGPTEVTLAEEGEALPAELVPAFAAFEDELSIPSGHCLLTEPTGEEFAELLAPTRRIHISVFVDDQTEPEHIQITFRHVSRLQPPSAG
jgi:hypothetical protein